MPAGDVLRQQHIDLPMGDYLQLSPQLHNMDVFFEAVLERKAQ